MQIWCKFDATFYHVRFRLGCVYISGEWEFFWAALTVSESRALGIEVGGSLIVLDSAFSNYDAKKYALEITTFCFIAKPNDSKSANSNSHQTFSCIHKVLFRENVISKFAFLANIVDRSSIDKSLELSWQTQACLLINLQHRSVLFINPQRKIFLRGPFLIEG